MKISASTPPGRPALLRSINHRRMLQAIRDGGPISRSALASELQLSRVTISSIARRLMSLDLVHESGIQDGGTVGRRAALLDLHPDLGTVLALDVDGGRVRSQLADLRGTVVERSSHAGPRDLDALSRYLVRCVAFASSRAPSSVVRHVVLAVPGAVDDEGVVRFAGSAPWLEGAPLARLLGEALPHTPLTVVNDVNMATLGEHRQGIARGWERYAFLAVRKSGIGMGLVIGGHLYRGARGRAGEVGPLRLGGESVLDSVYARQEARAANELARVLAVTFAVLDVDGVVVHSELEQGYDWFAELGDHLGELVPYPVRLVMSRLGEHAVLTGATALALDRAWPALEAMAEGDAP